MEKKKPGWALDANKELTMFTVDASWDKENHPENWYFRSDHLPYAPVRHPGNFLYDLITSGLPYS